MFQHVLGRHDGTLDMTLRHVEYLALGEPDELRDVGVVIIRTPLYLRCRADQFPLDIFLGHDLGVKLDVGRRTDLLRQLGQICGTTDLGQLFLRLEFLRYREEVYGFEVCRQLLDSLVYETVLLRIESIGHEVLLNGDYAVTFEHQRSQHGLFELDGLRRHIAGKVSHRFEGFAVALRRFEIFCHLPYIFQKQNYQILS